MVKRTIQLNGSPGLLNPEARVRPGELLTVMVVDGVNNTYYVDIQPRQPVIDVKKTRYEANLGESIFLEYEVYDPDGQEKQNISVQTNEEAIQVIQKNTWKGTEVKALKPGVHTVKIVAECEYGTVEQVFEVDVPWPKPIITGQTVYRTPLGVPIRIKPEVQSQEGDVLMYEVKKGTKVKVDLDQTTGEFVFTPKMEGGFLVLYYVNGNGGEVSQEYQITVDPPLLPTAKPERELYTIEVGEKVLVPIEVTWPNDYRPSIMCGAKVLAEGVVHVTEVATQVVEIEGIAPGKTWVVYNITIRDDVSITPSFEVEVLKPVSEQVETVDLLDAATRAATGLAREPRRDPTDGPPANGEQVPEQGI